MPDLNKPQVREELVKEMTSEGLFQLEKVNIRNNEYFVYANAPKTLREYFDFGLVHGEWEFLIYQNERYTFNEIYKLSAGMAHKLSKDFGVKKGDSVAFSMRNYPEWIITYIAATCIGAIAVPLNSWWKRDELEYGITHSESKIFIGDKERLKEIEGLIPEVSRIAVRTEGYLPDNSLAFENIIKPEDSFPEVEIEPEDNASIMYTSGSTGYPKGVLSSHRSIIMAPVTWIMLGMLASKVDAGAGPSMPENPSTLAAVPLFHVTGSHSIFLMSLLIKRKIVLMYKWDPVSALDIIEKEKITMFNGVPTMTHEILQASKLYPEKDLSSLKDLGAGGAPRPPEQLAQHKKEFPDKNALIGYGLTETNAGGTNAGGQFLLNKPSTAGFPMPLITEIRIVDEQNNVLNAEEEGEIEIKTASNFTCYWKNKEATDEVLSKEGWFKSGDIGYLDDEGFLFIKDRKKDIVIRGGENIACLEVEAVMHENAYVREVSVFGVPDDRLGEKLVARVTVSDLEKINELDLQNFLQGKIASFKVPEIIWLQIDSLPKIASGKTAKKEMREDAIIELGLSK
ncbi:MAG: class I adenylate-forming enzyme family protein [SAR86 cluster bacterium]|nr:class I adenylate-forming enzyme family protein [SAR86 cluster bacterium]